MYYKWHLFLSLFISIINYSNFIYSCFSRNLLQITFTLQGRYILGAWNTNNKAGYSFGKHWVGICSEYHRNQVQTLKQHTIMELVFKPTISFLKQNENSQKLNNIFYFELREILTMIGLGLFTYRTRAISPGQVRGIIFLSFQR